jgi:hypothetical protein
MLNFGSQGDFVGIAVSIFQEYLPVLVLVIGIMALPLLVNMISLSMGRLKEKREIHNAENKAQVETLLSYARKIAGRGSNIKSLTKSEQKALALHKKHREIMSSPDTISVKTT